MENRSVRQLLLGISLQVLNIAQEHVEAMRLRSEAEGLQAEAQFCQLKELQQSIVERYDREHGFVALAKRP